MSARVAVVVALLCMLPTLALAQQPVPVAPPQPAAAGQPAPGRPGQPLPVAPGVQAVPRDPSTGLPILPAPGQAPPPGVVLGADAPVKIEQPAPAGKGTALAFWLFAVMCIGGAIATITRRNAVSAVMCLVGTFFAIAGLYVMLMAHFMAAIQVLVYAGAIMVLFVFVVMILNKEEEDIWGRHWIGKSLAVGALVYCIVRLVNVLWTVKTAMPETPWGPGEFATFGTTKAIGHSLFTSYLFPFEAISIALVIAIVGAVVLAHPEHVTETHDAEKTS